ELNPLVIDDLLWRWHSFSSRGKYPFNGYPGSLVDTGCLNASVQSLLRVSGGLLDRFLGIIGRSLEFSNGILGFSPNGIGAIGKLRCGTGLGIRCADNLVHLLGSTGIVAARLDNLSYGGEGNDCRKKYHPSFA